MLGNLRRREVRVGGGGDGAEHGRRHERENELRRVVEENHDNVASADSEFGESRGGLTRESVGLGVGIGFSGGAEDQTGAMGENREILEAVGVEGEVIGDGNVR